VEGEFLQIAATEDIDTIFTIVELHNGAVRVANSVVVGDMQALHLLDETALKIPTGHLLRTALGDKCEGWGWQRDDGEMRSTERLLPATACFHSSINQTYGGKV
jgi:hypothetical protein